MPSYDFLCTYHLFINRFAMTKALAIGLGLPESYFADKCSPPMTILAFWHYPPYPADTDSWGVGPHTDYGMWTFLLQDNIGGLEVEITEGQWLEVKPIPGITYINYASYSCPVISFKESKIRLPFVQFQDKWLSEKNKKSKKQNKTKQNKQTPYWSRITSLRK